MRIPRAVCIYGLSRNEQRCDIELCVDVPDPDISRELIAVVIEGIVCLLEHLFVVPCDAPFGASNQLELQRVIFVPHELVADVGIIQQTSISQHVLSEEEGVIVRPHSDIIEAVTFCVIKIKDQTGISVDSRFFHSEHDIDQQPPIGVVVLI